MSTYHSMSSFGRRLQLRRAEFGLCKLHSCHHLRLIRIRVRAPDWSHCSHWLNLWCHHDSIIHSIVHFASNNAYKNYDNEGVIPDSDQTIGKMSHHQKEIHLKDLEVLPDC